MFPAPVEGKQEYLFGSLAAIYEKFTPSQIGCKLSTLWKAKIEPNKPKKTSNCTISKHEVVRKEQQKRKE